MKIAFFDAKEYEISHYNDNNLDFTFFETRLTKDTVSLTKGFDAVCVFVNDDLNNEVIDNLYDNGVKLIALRCAGFNNVDVKACFKKIHVVHVPSYSPHAIAEHAMALLLTSVRRTHKAYNRTREFNFSLNNLCGFDLYGKTIGVIGTGKIGYAFINICKGFGMNIKAFDLFPKDDKDITYTSLDDIYKTCDIISLHCPLTDDTYHLINKSSISKMKKGVIIVNTSRGALIDAEELVEGIKERIIGAACLDVYEEESDIFFKDSSNHIMNDDTLARLLSFPNVIITSHQAYLTSDALHSIAETTINNILDFFNNDSVTNEICYRCDTKCTSVNDKKRCF